MHHPPEKTLIFPNLSSCAALNWLFLQTGLGAWHPLSRLGAVLAWDLVASLSPGCLQHPAHLAWLQFRLLHEAHSSLQGFSLL